MSKFPHLHKALEDMDDLVEAIRTDNVIMLARSEGERLILVKHDALFEALDRLDLVSDAMDRFGNSDWTTNEARAQNAWIDLVNAIDMPMEDK